MLQRVAAPQSLPLRHYRAWSLANNVENLATRAKRVYGLSYEARAGTPNLDGKALSDANCRSTRSGRVTVRLQCPRPDPGRRPRYLRAAPQRSPSQQLTGQLSL